MILQENVPLAAHTTLGLGGAARYWAEITSNTQIPEALAWAEARGLDVLVLGSGSNVVAADAGFPGMVLHVATRGVRENPTRQLGDIMSKCGRPLPGSEAQLQPDQREGGASKKWLCHDGRVSVAAGEGWDAFVGRCVGQGWAGIECLSGIPGTVGATPVQNVGAYGQEVADTITAVRAWDRRGHTWVELSRADCGFGYRTSRFNTANRGRFLITEVTFQLQPGGAATLRYPELRKHVGEGATLAEVREAVLALRRGKAMVLEAGEPNCRSAGSFFKNPIVDAAAAPAAAPQFAEGNGRVKIPAAWLIEQAGIAKGFRLPGSGIHVSTKHVLALVNDGSGTSAQLMALAQHIRAAVHDRWGITLAQEPVPVGF